jgi:hypothetical protein
MKYTLIGLIATTVLIINSSCQKQIPTTLQGYFYTTDSNYSENRLKLLIDGVDKGTLPFINQSFTDSMQLDSNIQDQALIVTFMSGTHQIQTIKSDGSMVASSKIYFEFYEHKTKSGTQSDIGAVGYKLINNTHQVLIWLSTTAK